MDFCSGLAAGGVVGRLVRDLRDRFKGNPKELNPGWRDPQDPAKKHQMASPDQQNRYASGAETKASAESTTGSIFFCMGFFIGFFSGFFNGFFSGFFNGFFSGFFSGSLIE